MQSVERCHTRCTSVHFSTHAHLCLTGLNDQSRQLRSGEEGLLELRQSRSFVTSSLSKHRHKTHVKKSIVRVVVQQPTDCEGYNYLQQKFVVFEFAVRARMLSGSRESTTSRITVLRVTDHCHPIASVRLNGVTHAPIVLNQS